MSEKKTRRLGVVLVAIALPAGLMIVFGIKWWTVALTILGATNFLWTGISTFREWLVEESRHPGPLG